MLHADHVWTQAVTDIMKNGREVCPRGKLTSELSHHRVIIDMRYPVVTQPSRRLSYQFMAAEAYWILSGDETVAGLAPYNSHIAQYSDDGVKFFGAYGPKIVSQLPYLIATLRCDPDSRQAGLTIWRENPPSTRDVPCTVAIFASIRYGVVHLHVFMRSSDVWLGLPYDVFTFSMLGHVICCRLNANRHASQHVTPGHLYLTAASMHLYQTDVSKVVRMTQLDQGEPRYTPRLYTESETALMETLAALRTSKKGDPFRWWEHHKEVVDGPPDV